MANINHERKEAIVFKAKELRTEWLHSRKVHRARQLAANVAVRKAWIGSDTASTRHNQLNDRSVSLSAYTSFEFQQS